MTDNLMPQKVVGTTYGGTEIELGTFSQGVVLEGDRLKDVASGETIVWQHHSTWETVGDGYGYVFKRVFVQAAS